MPFTRAGMVDAAKKSGYTITERTVTDWANLGLLDHPRRTSRGPGGGSGAFYVWRDSQRDLLLALLGQRSKAKDIIRLCAMPVSVWLLWGDEWITLSQTRRALTTWADGYSRHAATEDRSLRAARQAVNKLAAPRASRASRAQLREALIAVIEKGASQMKLSQLAPLISAVVDPEGKGRTYGPLAIKADDLVHYVTAIVNGLAVLASASDGMFVEARVRHRMMAVSYIQDWPVLAAHPTFGSWFEQPTLERFVNNACRDLTMHLELITSLRQEGRELPPAVLIPWNRPPTEILTTVPPARMSWPNIV